MSSQRQLNALLFELQTARSPVAQAKILARAWRTVRELSPTDRKLLARHAGFDGAEEILDGLAKKSGGMAPAMLLRLLTNARATDASTLRNLLSAFRDPARRDEAFSRSLDLAADLMKDQQPGGEVEEELDEVRAVELVAEETPEEALAALQAVATEGERGPGDAGDSTERATDDLTDIEPERTPDPPPARMDPSIIPEPEPAPEKPVPPSPPPVVDWSRWGSADQPSGPAPIQRDETRPGVSAPNARQSGTAGVAAVVGAETSVLARLLTFKSELHGLAGSDVTSLGELIEIFPDGWARRRAMSALIRAGIPHDADDVITLLSSSLGRELDRRWCLGALAGRGDLRGASFDRANELLSSPSARRRFSALVSQSRSES